MTDHTALQPNDVHNQELESNVRPPGWINPAPTGRYNLVVIGAGTAGLVTAAGAAGMGAKVALIERSLMGGDCLNVGCVPSKGIISAARVAAGLRNAHEFGVEIHVKKGTDKIVGATIVARHAGDMISELTLAMTHGLGLKKIGSTIHPYPTQAEAIRRVGDQYNRTRLTPLVKSLFHKWLAWTR